TWPGVMCCELCGFRTRRGYRRCSRRVGARHAGSAERRHPTRIVGGEMTAYRTIVVGTDGSDSSYVAVEKAAALAADAGATLIVACAYYPTDDREIAAAADVLKDEAYQVRGSAPTTEILRVARDKA